MAEFIFVIYSCQKNLEIANKMYRMYFSNTELLNSLNVKVLIMYGDTTISNQFLVKDDKYLVLHCEDNNYFLNTIFANFNQIKMAYINLNALLHFKENEEDCFTYNPPGIFNEDVFINGYFQNEKYFLSIKTELLPLFKQNEVYNKFV